MKSTLTKPILFAALLLTAKTGFANNTFETEYDNLAACGGSTQQLSGVQLCCHLDEKLQCNEEGECWCQLDPSCQLECSPQNSCGLLPECKTQNTSE